MKKIMLIILLGILILPGIFASSVTRSFSSTNLNSGDTLTVTLDVVVDSGDTFYLIDELYPSTSWNVLSNGGGDELSNPTHIFWTVLSGATSTTYVYTLQVPNEPGIHTFSGESGFGLNPTANILGPTQVTVSGSSSPTIKINEFEANPLGTDTDNEWIELYNPNAFSVDITGWKIIDSGSSETILSGTIGAGGYLVISEPTFSLSITNTDEILTLKDDSDVVIDTTDTLSDGDNDDKTWQRIPNGASIWEFVNQTKGTSNLGITPPPIGSTDDLMVNYIRGKILIDGVKANAGQEYFVEVLSGANDGYIFNGVVDNEVPSQLQGNGYFDTRDQLEFISGDQFRIQVNGYNCFENGVFLNGGNGDFNDESSLVVIECNINAPSFDNVVGQIKNEGEPIEFSVNAVDPNGQALTYSSGALPPGATFINKVFSWTPGFDQSGNYNVQFYVEDTDGFQDSMSVGITVNNVEEPLIFSDAPMCSDPSNMIKVEIKDPDDGDDFEIGDIIDVEVKVSNDFFEDLDFDVEVHLYDLDDDESVEDADSDMEIEEREDETFDFELEIPEDIEDNDFVVYVYVENEDEECQSEFVEINIERLDDALSIDKIKIIPNDPQVGDIVEFLVRVDNIGTDDQDIRIEIRNDELGLNIVSDEFELEEYGEDDSDTQTFLFTVPDVESGVYDIEFEVFFSGESVKDTSSLHIYDKVVHLFEDDDTSFISRELIRLNFDSAGENL